MSILDTQEAVSGSSPYQYYQLGNQENGFVATLFYVGDSEELESEHGKFYCMQGLGFDANSKTEDDVINSCKLVSIIPNTMLKGMITNGAFAKGSAYKVTKKWTKGDKYQGRAAKGHGYDVSKFGLPATVIEKLYAKHNELLPEGLKIGSTEAPAKVEI